VRYADERNVGGSRLRTSGVICGMLDVVPAEQPTIVATSIGFDLPRIHRDLRRVSVA
jgi:hypothetical protein